MITLENDDIKADIHPHGAELQSVFSKKTQIEYLWNGDAAFWPRHAPVLFPIVGGLIDDSFTYNGETYHLEKHGFARDTDFEVESSTATTATFLLKSNEETLKSYPFAFELRLKYTLEANTVHLEYHVSNPAQSPMYFSIGSHPAFKVPLTEGGYEDHALVFSEVENADSWGLNGNYLTTPSRYLDNQQKLELKHELFYNDAVIFKDLKSTAISIVNNKNEHGLTYTFEGFPYMGIWAAKDAPFVCIEPWCGIPDSIDHDQNLENKEGIIKLEGQQSWAVSQSIACF
ncbi:galactose mutarotase-like enzyme [Arcticibacter pallidicorallinus]|uniref:Galactose mutarotase-like enzyme n=1 Tax=Arcticibacter pallidicorallinus TaxID=1259464 RepID=A0A2T0U7G7_9SPHI|nr:aldose 1-epimerase family protein [Arcticibacter pallidicorallinus]PRY53866.1 galactose mutarotase-like enzyme [Arcticibacter pallidicorallinus]